MLDEMMSLMAFHKIKDKILNYPSFIKDFK